MSSFPATYVSCAGFADGARRDFIKHAAALGAFAVPFVTSFTAKRGLEFGVGRASAQYGDGGVLDRIRERQEEFRERVRERQERIRDRIRERRDAADEAAERLRSLLERLGQPVPDTLE